MTTRTIVLGVDGSESSAAATTWAAEYAPVLDAEVVVVHSLDVALAIPPPTVAAPPFVVDDELRQVMRDALQEWCEPLRAAGVPYRATLYEGNPAVAIMQIAEEERADLIVVGRRGHGGFAELLLGSVPRALTAHAPVPVVVVPPVSPAGGARS